MNSDDYLEVSASLESTIINRGGYYWLVYSNTFELYTIGQTIYIHTYIHAVIQNNGKEPELLPTNQPEPVPSKKPCYRIPCKVNFINSFYVLSLPDNAM